MATEIAQERRRDAAGRFLPRDQQPARTTPRPNAYATASGGAMVAAALRLDPTDTALARKVKLWRQDWQRYAWDFDETLSEIHYAHDYYGNVVSRVRLFAGFQVDPDDPPVPLDDLDRADEQPKGSTKAVSDAALDEMRRLDMGADGGLPAISGDFAVNLALTGEAFLHGTEDLDKPGGESFSVYSVEEFKASDSGYAIFPKGASQGIPIQPDDYVLRVWRRWRRFRDLADAPMRALLDDCDNLHILKRVLRAVSSSRIHGGIFLAPSEWSFPQRATDPNAQSQATDDPLTEQMNIAFTTPLQDPSSVNSVMPLILRGPADSLEKARWIDLGRPYGEQILKEIADLRTGIAVGLDLPIQVLTGIGDLNHWSSWQIAEETFKSHIEPLVLVICRALTDGFLKPALIARGLNPDGYSVYYDASALIGHADLFTNMKLMHDAFAVSDDALRRAGGAADDDAPDDDEVLRRLYIQQQLKVAVRETGIAPANDIQAPSDLALQPEAPGQPSVPSAAKAPLKPSSQTQLTPPSPAPPAVKGQPGVKLSADQFARTFQGLAQPDDEPLWVDALPVPALTASASGPLAQLGPRLAQIDQRLTAQVQTLADSALQRALERAGAMVARKVNGAQPSRQRSTGLAAEIKGIDIAEVAQFVGREQTLAFGLDEDKLIDGQLGTLEPEYRKLVQRALAAALLAGRRAVPDGGLDDDRVQSLTAQQDTFIAAGFAILSAAVLATAHDQLFTPAAQPSGPGELDLSARVDTSAVRDSLAVAGGASANPTPAGAPPGGVATGQLVMDTFRQALQILPSGWQWVYGYPDRPFEPHENLEGVEFSSWTDDVLTNDGDWPDVSFYRPGDHRGCACSFVPMFASDRPSDDNGEPPEEG